MTVIFGRNRHIAVPAMTGVRVHSHHGGASGNGLLNNLIAYWPGDEESGNLLDAHTNELDLTDTNTVTYAAGKVYANARQYTAANSEYHVITDNASLSVGDVDFTIAAWVYFDAVPSVNSGVFLKGDSAAGTEYCLYYRGADNVFRFYVYSSGYGTVNATTFGKPNAETWYLVVCSHDSVNNELCIAINNGTIDKTSWSAGSQNTIYDFVIGRFSTAYWNGRIGPTMFWKSAAGEGGVLTAAQRTAIYNDGNGLAYASFTS